MQDNQVPGPFMHIEAVADMGGAARKRRRSFVFWMLAGLTSFLEKALRRN